MKSLDHQSTNSSKLFHFALSFTFFCLAPICAQDAPKSEYTIETIAGNGKNGDLLDGGGPALEVPVDLPFGLATGPDGALYITCVGSHRVLRLDRKTRRLTSVAGSGRKGYAGDGGPATAATLNEPYEVRFDSRAIC